MMVEERGLEFLANGSSPLREVMTGLVTKASQLCDPRLATGAAFVGGPVLMVGGKRQTCQCQYLTLKTGEGDSF